MSSYVKKNIKLQGGVQSSNNIKLRGTEKKRLGTSDKVFKVLKTTITYIFKLSLWWCSIVTGSYSNI